MSKLSETPPPNSSADLAVQELPGLRSSAGFSPEHRRTLLSIAHEAILCGVERRPFAVAPPDSPALSEPRGVFTTLYLPKGLGRELCSERRADAGMGSEVHRELRGCVGYAVPVAPLYRAVAETARAAAFDDSRFLPVTKEEAPRLQVSLSVLSHLFPIHPEAVEVGRHGLIISQGARRGLLLPQVPAENDWDRETFLEQTCRKAGLPWDAWRRGASIDAFTAEVFSDADVVPG